MNHQRINKRLFSFLMSIILLVELITCAYATSTPDVTGAFSLDDEQNLIAYETAYDWNDSVMQTYAWTLIDADGNEYKFKRQTGYQKEFLEENIMTTRQYLGLYVGNYGSGENIVAVARAELDNPENKESPIGSDNVFYNTWYYGREVHNVDTNENGKYDYGDTQYYPWCCVFVDWCANECGYIDSELFPRTAGCAYMYSFMTITQGFDSVPVLDTTPMGGSAYTPVPGDLMFFKDADGAGFGHIGLISEVEADGFWTIEGNSNYRVSHNYYNTSSEYRVTQGQIVHVVYPDSNGEERSKEIYNYLTDVMGMTPVAAAAALGNMQMESGCIPNRIENGVSWEDGAGFGLIQWTNTDATGRVKTQGTLLSATSTFYFQNGLRRTNLVNYATTHGLSFTDLYAQLDFLNEEMNHYSIYSNAITEMNNCKNNLAGAHDAALIWLEYIEGIPRSSPFWRDNADKRQAYTTAMYNKYV